MLNVTMDSVILKTRVDEPCAGDRQFDDDVQR